ncbi:MAG: sulfite exporter TauE/SafE family protein [Acidobacteria bacterium]|nr:MAG: sulfite exporter TauE/SafE family protein [Acidobacteriota bacterium]
MPAISATIVVALFVTGAAAGALGALLGLGGGVFLVPLLVLVFDVPMRVAVGISLTTVIATSSVATSGAVGRSLINLRLGMLLEVATTAGGLTGGLVAVLISPRALQRLFGVVAISGALVMFSRLQKRNVILDPSAQPGRLGGRYFEDESGAVVTYRVKRLPLAMFVSFLAGSVSSLLGLGGGILKVPALNAWCGVPLRAAAATSAFMIGVTATAGAVIYYGRGEIVPWMASASILGVMIGSRGGFRIGAVASARWLKLMLIAVLLAVSVLMFLRAG